MSVRLVPAPINLVYSKVSDNKEAFEKEYQQLSGLDEDPINQWLKLAKARGETAETDDVLLNLIVELHRKIDNLEMILKNETPKRVSLSNEAAIESIGHDHFKLELSELEAGESYYARVTMPVHPKRDVAIYFKAIDKSLVEIIKIHERDSKEWSSYLTARERILIREARENKS